MIKLNSKQKECVLNTLDKLKEYQQSNDIEHAHIQADEALTDLLTVLGLYEIVTEYEKIHNNNS